MKHCLVTAALLALLCSASQAQPVKPTVRPAIDAVLAAFDKHPLVGIGDAHGMAQETDFYAALVGDPRFAAKIKDIVVEFGSAGDQDIMDRYANDQDVPYTELRKIWTDTMGWAPPPFDLGYANFFAQVRATNQKLGPADRIHVWLGDPPVDWSSLHKREDFKPLTGVRDRYPADLIEREILSRGRKALVIYGTWHFNTDTTLTPLIGSDPSLATLVKQKHPDAWFIVVPYTGFMTQNCATDFESQAQGWTVPAIATPVANTSLDDAAFRARCPKGPHEPMPPAVSKEQAPQLIDHFERMMAGLGADALLYLGPASSLVQTPHLADVYLDEDYRKEVVRHMELLGRSGTAKAVAQMAPGQNTAIPQPYH